MKNRFLLSLIAFLCWHTGSFAQKLVWETATFTLDSNRGAYIVKHDSSNNIYTLGLSRIPGTYICKHDSNGHLLWQKDFKGQSSVFPRFNVKSMKVDKAGNTYIAGYIDNDPVADTGFVTKIDPYGNVLWNRYETGYDKACVRDMVLLPDNNIGIQVTRTVSDHYAKVYIECIDQNSGTLIWSQPQDMVDTALYYGGAYYTGACYISCDAIGNIYAVCPDYNRSTFLTVFASYTKDGSLRWQTKTATPLYGSDQVNGFSTDYAGNTYAFFQPKAHGQQTIIKLDNTGVYKYIRNLTLAGNYGLMTSNLECDSVGNCYFIGITVRNSLNGAFVIGKIDTAGSLVWINEIPNGGNYSCGYLKNDHTYYVAGDINDPATLATDALLLNKYDNDGNIVWSERRGYHHIYHVSTGAGGIDVDESGNILVVGGTSDTTIDALPPDNLSHYKYTEYLGKWRDVETASVIPIVEEFPNLIYPNPAADEVYISLPSNKPFSWEVYNMEGKRMTSGNVTIANHDLEIMTTDWPAGNYIFHATGMAEQISRSARFTILK